MGDTLEFDSVNITAASYAALPIANDTINGRSVRAERLATWLSPSGPPQLRPYKRLRVTIDAATVRTYLYFPVSPTIDVRLFSYGTWPIYPRLLRIRNWTTQQVLGGNADATLISAANTLASVRHNDSAKSWTLMIENSEACYHNVAYVHNLFCDNNLPGGNVLQPGPDGLLPRVWRDQCEDTNLSVAKGQLWYEAGLFGGVGWRLHDNVSTSSPVFNEYIYGIGNDNYWTPVPSAVMPDSFSAFRHGIHVLGDTAFKRNYQDSIIGYASDNTAGGRGWEDAMKDYASSCYDNPTYAPPVPMLMSPQLLGGHFLMP